MCSNSSSGLFQCCIQVFVAHNGCGLSLAISGDNGGLLQAPIAPGIISELVDGITL